MITHKQGNVKYYLSVSGKQKLTVMLNVHGDYDVIPLVVPRDKKDELTEKIKYSVSHMRIDTDIKKTMLDGIDNTTVKVK